jgi:hypothetical protein
MTLEISHLADANCFTDLAYPTSITSYKLRQLVKLFHVPFFILNGGFMS